MRKYFHIFGVQRTATTFTTNVIVRNTIDKLVITDTKHREFKYENYTIDNYNKRIDRAKENNNDRLCDNLKTIVNDVFERGANFYPVVVIKNPYSWFQSISWWVKDNNNKFDMELWYGRYNKAYQSWKDLLENPQKPFQSGMVSRYENLLRAPKDLLYRLKKDTGVELREDFSITDRMASQRSDSDRNKIFTEERKQFYLQNGNFGLSKNMIKKITDLVDWELMKFYGYEPKGG